MEKAHIKVCKNQALCIQSSSSMTKDYVSKKDVEELLIFADIKCEAQMDKTHKLLERIKILEMRNKDMENFRNQLVKPKKQEHLNSGTKYPHIDLVNDLPKMEMLDLMDAELDLLILNGFDKEVVKSDESNNDKVERDLWMLHC
ncbi:BMA-NST-1, isoform e [Dirofilaria immitis]|nr:BMA-NST-1, isoform e [Dirofilaria immitis]